MSDTIIVGAINFFGVLIGTLGGIGVSGKLMSYRIDRLEDEVKKHNQLIERVYKLEEHSAVMDEQIKVANHRIDDLENRA